MDNTKGYQSPIMLYFQTMQAEVAKKAKKLDEDIYEEVLRYGVSVDKEELIRALAYDRDQYQRGFDAGYEYAQREALKHAHWEKHDDSEECYCSNCGEPGATDEDVSWHGYCPICGAIMDEEAEEDG